MNISRALFILKNNSINRVLSGAYQSRIINNATSVIKTTQRYKSSSPAHCKVALITGGATGIGVEFANSLLLGGAKGVVLGDIQEKEGQQAACELSKKYGPGKALFKKCDVTNESELEDLFKCALEMYKGLDIVINNAGLLQDSNWRQEIKVNVAGLVYGTLLGFEYMNKNKNGCGGAIVNMSSITGLTQAFVCPIYCGTKGFVLRFSNAFGHEYYEAFSGVKVFTICPGITDTGLIDDSAKYALQGFGDIATLLSGVLKAGPTQPASALGEGLIKVLTDGENGSIWVIEASECYKIKIPERQSIRVA